MMVDFVPAGLALDLASEMVAAFLNRALASDYADQLAEGDGVRAHARLETIEREVLADFRRQLDQLKVAGSA